MFKLCCTITALLAIVTVPCAQANIQINFVESAPKDSFIIKNIGECDLKDLSVEIDLSLSDGKLIFDTTASGAGVEVFQPFEIQEGKLRLAPNSSVGDGDKSVSVVVESLRPDSSVSFTIDVDDTLAKGELGQIRVTGSEIQGAQVILGDEPSKQLVAAFNEQNTATLILPPCS